jgi:hypothetical protein
VLHWLPVHNGRGAAAVSDGRRAALTEPTACAAGALYPSQRRRI